MDVLGAVAATSGTALVLYGLVRAGEGGWATAGTLLPITAGGGCYLAFIAVERRARVPLVRPSLLIRRPVVSGAFVMLVGTGLMLGLFFLTSWYLQHGLGLGAMQTGLVFLPVAVAITAGAQLAGRLLATLGGRIVGTAGFVLAGTGAAALTQAPASGTPLLVVLPGFLVSAVGIGVTFVTATGTTLANVHHDEAGVASAVVSTFHELGGAIGVAVVSTVAVTSLVPGGSTSGFGAGYLTLAVAAGVAVLVVPILVPPGKPARTVGHGH